MSPTSVCSTLEAMPSPASCGTPRCPIMTESIAMNKGSTTSDPNAGSASQRMSRLRERATCSA